MTAEGNDDDTAHHQLVEQFSDRISAVPLLNSGQHYIFLGAHLALDAFKAQTAGWQIHIRPAISGLLSAECPDCAYFPLAAFDKPWVHQRCSLCAALQNALAFEPPLLLICDYVHRPILAIDHLGYGHGKRPGGDPATRALTKALALKAAAIDYLQTPVGTTDGPARDLIIARLNLAKLH